MLPEGSQEEEEEEEWRAGASVLTVAGLGHFSFQKAPKGTLIKQAPSEEEEEEEERRWRSASP